MKSDLNTFKDRFWKKVHKLPNGCWEWTGKLNSNGYGRCVFLGKEYYAHRISFSWLVGDIPSGKVIDHLCRNRKCVNPDHLEIVTQKENVLRGRSEFSEKKKRTHCIHGHLLEGYNLVVYKNGTRHCRTCARFWDSQRPSRLHTRIGIEDKN